MLLAGEGTVLAVTTVASSLCRVAAMLQEHGLASAAGWLAAWQAVWRKQLASCTPEGQCCL